MTAAVIWLALKELGASNIALYDEVSQLVLAHFSPISLTWAELDRLRYEASKQDTERIRVNLIHSDQTKRCVYRRLEVKQNAILQLDTLCQLYNELIRPA